MAPGATAALGKVAVTVDGEERRGQREAEQQRDRDGQESPHADVRIREVRSKLPLALGCRADLEPKGTRPIELGADARSCG